MDKSIQTTSCWRLAVARMLVLVAALTVGIPAYAALYSFDSIVERVPGDPDALSPLAAPSISDSGTVAFLASFNGDTGAYISNGGEVTTIATEASPFLLSVNPPAINSSDQVALSVVQPDFSGGGIFGSELLLRATNGTLEAAIAITNSGFFGVRPTINSSGTLGLRLGNGFGGVSIYTADQNSPDARTFIASSGGTSGLIDLGNPDINDPGSVAFHARIAGGESAIYVGDGLATSRLVDTTGAFSSLGVYPALNNIGEVAFVADLDAGGSSVSFLKGNMIETVADTSGAFSYFGDPDINDLGTMVFLAGPDDGGMGIFSGPDANADKVIATGDPLFGSNVTRLDFLRGLNNPGQISFLARLDDGREGIFRATPQVVPVPAAVWLFCSGLLGLIVITRNKKA